MKADFLNECMSDAGAFPVDEFNRRYCLICLNHDCARSMGSASAFEKRARSWKSTLFDDVPRARDGEFPEIRSKKFLPISNDGSLNVNIGFVSQTLEPVLSSTEAPLSTPVPISTEALAPEAIPDASVEIALSSPAPVIRAKPPAHNTPIQHGILLRPDAPPTYNSSETTLESGASYTFGDDE